MPPPRTRSVAVIGAGAAGAAAAVALKAEECFDIRVFERRECPGGTWIFDADPNDLALWPGKLPPDIDPAIQPPDHMPATTPPSKQERYAITPIYDNLTTNVPNCAMSLIGHLFPYGPFVPHWVPKQSIQNYFSDHGMDSNLALNTTVEQMSKIENQRWRLTLRKHTGNVDAWWQEEFDAVVVANGHYAVPFVPEVKGLSEFMTAFPGRVEHSKVYRTPHAYTGQRVLIIGNSASGHDITTLLNAAKVAKSPIYVSRRSRSRWEGREPPTGIVWKPVVAEYQADGTIVFTDGSTLQVDKVIYCTGYKPSYPFWDEAANGRPLYDYRADVLINSYQHTFIDDFPTIGFVGLPRVLTFRSFEYQAIALARLWSCRNSISLPSTKERDLWRQQRACLCLKERRKFHQIDWETGETMEWFQFLFELSGLPLLEGPGRHPPVLDRKTRWAIEHVRKYPEPGKEDPVSEADDWVVIEGSGKDLLHFL